jgi:Ca2+-binding RTX toxin-like protein
MMTKSLIGAININTLFVTNLTSTFVRIPTCKDPIMANISGDSGNNLLTGTTDADFIDGLGGNDTINGGDGNDFIVGGLGLDSLNGGIGLDTVSFEFAAAGITLNLATGIASNNGEGQVESVTNFENVHGSRFNDVIQLSAASGYVFARAGNDSITGGIGDDNFYGGSGNDTLNGGAGLFDNASYFDDGSDGAGAQTQGVTVNLTTGIATDNWGGTDTLVAIENVGGSSLADNITGDANNNNLDGQTGNDTLLGLAGNDFLNGGAGNDSLDGGDGDSDGLRGGSGNDTLNGGIGQFDSADYFDFGSDPAGAPTQGVTVNLTTGIATDNWGGTDTLVAIENVTGSALADTLVGNANNNYLNGSAGNDTLFGLAGNDFLDGGAGNDSLDGGDNEDGLRGGSGNDTLNGGIGQSNNADYFDFGNDAAGAPTQGITANLTTGIATDNWGGTDTLINIANVTGSALNDSLTGNTGNNRLEGRDGNDSLFGGGGDDFVIGGLGNDLIDGGAGTGDWTEYFDAVAAVNASLATGIVTGGGGNDTLTGIENLTGSNFSDTLTGDANNNSLRGNAGNDTLSGGDGNDYITGGAGNDSIIGGNGTGDTADYFFSAAIGAINASLVTGLVTGGEGNDTLAGIENINGTNFNDTITGDAASNRLEGQGGDDTLLGGAGEDTLIGGVGNDLLDGGANDTNIGFDFVDYQAATSAMTINLALGTASGGGLGNDTLVSIDGVFGSNFNDTIIGTAGNDFIRGNAGNDSLDGGSGLSFDTLDYNGTSTAINANLATGIVTGGAGNDTVSGFEQLRGGLGADVLTGDSSDNRIRGNAGNDTIDGGTGNDTADYLTAASAVVVNLLMGTATGGDGSDTLISIERIRASNFNDTLNGDNNANSIEGAAGNDTIFGNEGGDFITAGLGDDFIDGGLNDIRQGLDWSNNSDAISSVTVNLIAGTVTGGSGTDTLVSIDAAAGGAFDDILTGDANFNFLRGNAGNDTLDGGAGFDFADYNNATSAVTVSLAAGTATGGDGNDTLISIEGVRGSSFNDTLIGSAADERFRGRQGDDSINGGAGSDTIDMRDAVASVTVNLALGTASGDGNDVFVSIENVRGSELAADMLIGSAGDNVFQGYGGNDTLDGAAGIDTASFSNSYMSGVIANLGTGIVANDGWGTTDTLIGIENLFGSQQADQLTGNSGANKLEGDLGNDILIGGDGADTLQGGLGSDTLTGGAGSDVFSLSDWTSAAPSTDIDTITDFAVGNAGDVVLGPPYAFGNPFANGDVRVTQSGLDTLVQVDTDGTAGPAVFRTIAILQNVSSTSLTAFNFNGFDPNSIVGTANADNLIGTAEGNYIDGRAGNDTITGLDGNDTLLGGEGNDSLLGGAGSDTVTGGAGNDTIDGGIVLDRVNYTDLNFISYSASTAGVNINLSGITGIGNTGSGTVTGDASVGVDTVSNASFLFASNFNDTVLGSSALIFEQFEGGGGNDTLNGGAITDTLNGDNSNRATYQNTAGAGVTVDLVAGTAVGNAGSNAGTDTLLNFNQVRGSNFADTLLGSDRTDVTESFEGRDGNDSINGRGGFDLVRYGSATGGITVNLVTGTASGLGVGGDTLLNIEGVFGSTYNDLLVGGNAANGVVYNDGLSELFRGDAGNDTIDGGQGYDLVDYFNSTAAVTVVLNDTLDGTASDGLGGTDVLRRIEAVRGSIYNDTLTGSNTAIFESFEGREGNDSINGLGGTDRADYRNARAGVTVNLATGTASDGYGGTDTLLNIENVRGARDFNDLITGSTANNRLEGLGGNDTLFGGGGNDTLEGGAGADSLDGGAGTDVVSYASATSGIQAYFYATPGSGGLGGDAAGDIYTNIEGVIGSAFADVLQGAAGIANSLDGGAGDDTLYGEGLDSIVGGAGNDVLFGGQGGSLNLNLAIAGLETIWGSVVGDTLNGTNATSALTLIGQGGADTMTGGAGDDFLYFDSTDTILGGAGLDWAVATLSTAGVNLNLNTSGFENSWGSTSNDTLSGAGATTTVVIIGDVGDDSITGGNAADFLYGFAGNDTLTGGAGGDVLLGGAGNDVFAYASLTGSGFDSIFDFTSGADKFQFDAASFGRLAGAALANGVSFISGAAPVAAGAGATVLYDTNTGILSYDLDGSGAAAAVSIAQLAGIPPVAASDFLFV